MFEFFAKKAVSGEEMYDDGSAAAMGASKGVVKVGGMEFMPGEPGSLAKFESWISKVKGTSELIPTGDGVTHVPASSAAGKAELLKAELQLKHGASPEQAQRAVDQIPGLKTAVAQKPVYIYKSSKVISDAPSGESPTVQQGTAKAAKAFRGPGGPVSG